MVNEIRTLKDLKDMLVKIPDEDLDRFGVGINPESDGDVTLLCEGDGWEKLFEKYPMEEFSKWLENIKKAQDKYTAQDSLDDNNDDFITS